MDVVSGARPEDGTEVDLVDARRAAVSGTASTDPFAPFFIDPPKRFQVLALDGGGARGLFAAHILARLESDLGVRITDSFDLIAGTSTGGIIALALGAGLRPAEIVAHYDRLVDAVFPSRRRRFRPLQLVRPLYSADALRSALTDVVGDNRLGDSLKPLIIPTWDVELGQVHIFKTPHHPRFTRDWRISMTDVAVATSAAPTYFPAARVDGCRLVDGGVWANDPSVVAVTEAVSVFGVPLGAVRVLSVGTIGEGQDHPKALDNGGLAQWSTRLVPTFMGATSRAGQGIIQHLVGRSNYLRINATIKKSARFSLDAVNRDDVEGLASSVSRVHGPDYTTMFDGHRAYDYEPLHATGEPTREGEHATL
ncbi:MAG: patatin-like phospholipase family protein [Bifidobacteriaceae bacterium]|jgi:patatin-like phospholipase/acyl hydrolase|nr:patatin-like phospholipase family protein [Bifidobacteriaceae bacterium]